MYKWCAVTTSSVRYRALIKCPHTWLYMCELLILLLSTDSTCVLLGEARVGGWCISCVARAPYVTLPTPQSHLNLKYIFSKRINHTCTLQSMGHNMYRYMYVTRWYVYYDGVSILRQEYLSRYRVPYTMYENTFRGRTVCMSAWNQWCVDISRPQPRHSWQYIRVYNWLNLHVCVHRKHTVHNHGSYRRQIMRIRLALRLPCQSD